MFQSNKDFSTSARATATFAIYFALILSISTAAAGMECSQAFPLDLNSTLRGYGEAGDAAQLFRVELPSAGIVTADISVSGISEASARLVPVRDCGDSNLTVIEHSATHVVLAAHSAGDVFLRAGTQDPRKSIGSYKIRLGFEEAVVEHETSSIRFEAGEAAVDQTWFLTAGTLTKNEDDIADPDPSSATFSHQSSDRLLVHVASIHVGPLEKTEDDIADPDPSSMLIGSTSLTPGTRADVVLFYESTRRLFDKNEDDIADPDPSAKNEDDIADPDPSAKNEDDIADPDPSGKRSMEERVLHGFVTLLAAAFEKNEDDIADPDPSGLVSGPGNLTSQPMSFSLSEARPGSFDATDPFNDDALLRWITEWLLRGDSPSTKLSDQGLRLRSFTDTAGTQMRRFASAITCRQGELDDHGDTFTCASPLRLGQSRSGELQNSWGDDSDLFTFSLTELTSVDIEAFAGTGIVAELFDASGRRLELDETGAEAESLRILTTLGPGHYFLRLQGSGQTAGPYELHLESRAW